MKYEALGFMVCTWFLIGALLHWMPVWRRHWMWFGVLVPPGYHETEEARSTLRTYRAAVWLLTVTSAVLTAAVRPVA